jgi:hypothetical protein
MRPTTIRMLTMKQMKPIKAIWMNEVLYLSVPVFALPLL